jgi:hypothetical protein
VEIHCHLFFSNISCSILTAVYSSTDWLAIPPWCFHAALTPSGPAWLISRARPAQLGPAGVDIVVDVIVDVVIDTLSRYVGGSLPYTSILSRCRALQENTRD